jgi:hypothetical protein
MDMVSLTRVTGFRSRGSLNGVPVTKFTGVYFTEFPKKVPDPKSWRTLDENPVTP